MNKKGFTLIELLAVLVLLGIIVGITIFSIGNIFKSAKEKSEDAFVATLSDAAEMYLTSKEAKEKLKVVGSPCGGLKKNNKDDPVNVYKVNVNFQNIIDSEYKPLTDKDFVNPANKDATCNVDALVTIYRDDDYVYYYSFDKEALGCLTKKDGIVTNLPELVEGSSC